MGIFCGEYLECCEISEGKQHDGKNEAKCNMEKDNNRDMKKRKEA